MRPRHLLAAALGASALAMTTTAGAEAPPGATPFNVTEQRTSLGRTVLVTAAHPNRIELGDLSLSVWTGSDPPAFPHRFVLKAFRRVSGTSETCGTPSAEWQRTDLRTATVAGNSSLQWTWRDPRLVAPAPAEGQLACVAVDQEAMQNSSVSYIGASGYIVPPRPADPPSQPPPDLSPPSTDATGPARTRKRTVTFKLYSSETSTFRCKLDRRAFALCGSPYTTPKLKVGRHRLQVEAMDAAGNTDPTPVVLDFRVVK